jgi:hypothetical protein
MADELHVPYKWCPKDECACYWPECAEHGCMDADEPVSVVDVSDELHQILGEALRSLPPQDEA